MHDQHFQKRASSSPKKKTLRAFLLDHGFELMTVGLIVWLLAKPWIPYGPPLERCLKGSIPYEFSEDDQNKIRKIIQDSELAYAGMNARHQLQWEQKYLELKPPYDVIEALKSTQIEEVLRLNYFFEEKRGAACREAAARVPP